MLDINFIRQNQDLVKKACADKQFDPKLVDQLVATDEKRRALQKKVDDLRQQTNLQADLIKQQVAAGKKPDPSAIEKGKAIKNELKQIEPDLKTINEQFQQQLLHIPNVPAHDVPIGADESGNVVVRQVGAPREFAFAPQSHETLMEKLDWLDTKRAVKISGFRAYFLKNQAVLLEQAILNYALKLLISEGFAPMSAPTLVNEPTMWGTGYFPWGNEDHYRTQDNQFLAGTSEVALTAYRQGETLTHKDLPYKMVGISPCYRREVGSYGKDTKGVIRVHQFNKVEQVIYAVADEEETRRWHEKMVGYSEKLLQDLELPYQVLLMCTGDMGAGQRKKYDIETWFPSQNAYRETHSASYFNDFQARRLDIKYQAEDGTLKHVYTLNNTMAATPRLLAAIIENYQQEDGSVKIPQVLQKYITELP